MRSARLMLRLETRAIALIRRIDLAITDKLPRPDGGAKLFLFTRVGFLIALINEAFGGVGGLFGQLFRRFSACKPSPESLSLPQLVESETRRSHKSGGAPSSDPCIHAIGSLGSGGAERQLTITVNGLSAIGMENLHVSVMNPLRGEFAFYVDDINSEKVLVRSLRAPTSRFRSAVPDELQGTSLGFDVAAYLEEFHSLRPSIVHAWLDDPNIAAGIAACLAGVENIILSGRNVNPSNFHFFKPYMKSAYNWLLTKPQVTLVNNSHAGAVDYANWLDISKSRISVIYNGFDWSELEEYREDAEWSGSQTPRKRRRIIGVMRLAAEKRPLHWLKTASLLSSLDSNLEFVIVGDGPLRNTCKEFIHEHSLGDRVQMLGRRKDVYALIASSDLLMLTSQFEGLPNVLVEAQYLGVPVAATAVGGSAETFVPGVTGVILDSVDAQVASEQVALVLADTTWLREAQTSSHLWAKETFSAEKMINRTLEIYQG